MNQTDWDFNEFLAFLLIYASHVDLDFSEDEKNQILNTVSPEIFEEVYAHFNSLTDFQALKLILDYKDLYYSTKEEKEHLFEEMHELFNADGEYSALEKDLVLFLNKLM
jgi:hypothetical protein